ncbi:MAG: peptidylprolyl isomerase [Gammaproteobacteria bacterium]|nr:peptidylprolyl isomerase [Gammaproteobacteria bacterium]MDE2347955.1 peptidylprolyl isomerase [Gammaproteobacteria bacterium]
MISRLFLFPLAAALLCAGAHAQTRDIGTRGVLLDRIAAVVNDGVVLKSQLDEQMASVTKRLEDQKVALPPQSVLQKQVLDRLILQEIEEQRAQHIGLSISDEQLNGAIQDIAARNKIPFDQLPNALAAQGIDYKQYRQSLRKELTLQALRERDVIARIVVTPAEIEQYLQREDSAASNDEFDISHILIALPSAASPQQIAELTKKADDVAARARAGENFAQLAIANSNSQTALEGGALGWRKGSQLPEFVLQLVTKMKPGEIGGPVRTPSGFNIIKLNGMRSGEKPVFVNQVHLRHILLKPNELDDDQTIRQKLLKIRQRILNGEDFAGIATTTSEDPGSAPDGGDLGWTSPSTFVPEFSKAIANLKINEISMPFKTRYGWHIVQLLGKRTVDDTTDIRRQKAFEAIRASKADEETELWLQRLRDDAFVEVRM